MKQSKVKFMKKDPSISLKDWEVELNREGRNGWTVIQIFTSPDGHCTALLRMDEATI